MGTDGIVWKSLEIFASSGNSPARSESIWNPKSLMSSLHSSNSPPQQPTTSLAIQFPKSNSGCHLWPLQMWSAKLRKLMSSVLASAHRFVPPCSPFLRTTTTIPLRHIPPPNMTPFNTYNTRSTTCTLWAHEDI